MKRILSIILTVAMLLTSINAFAIGYSADRASADVLDSEFAQQTIGNFKSSTAKGGTNVSGMYGKAADDVSGLYAESAGGKYYYIAYHHNEPIYMDNGSELDGKLVLEFNFKAVNNDFTFAQIAISIRQRAGSEQISPKTAGYNPYGWNHVKWVYDPTGHGDFNTKGTDDKYVVEDGAVLGTTVTYLNGVQLGNGPKTIVNKNVDSGIFNNGANEVLIQIFSGDTENVHSAYIDDVKVYKEAAPAAPASAALLAGSTYTVNGFDVAAQTETKVSDIQAANTALEIKAFSDATFTNELAADAVINVDNYIIAKSADGVYGTYRVADPMEASYLVNISQGIVEGKGVSKVRIADSVVNGFGGKLAHDASLKAQFEDPNGGKDYNSYLSFNGYTNTDKNKHYVLEFNICLDTATGLSIGTAQNTPVVKGLDAGVIPQKKWNKVVMWMDYSGEYPVGRVFVNGAELEDKRIDHSDSAKKIFGVNATELRLIFASSADDARIVYFDDIKAYESDVAPTAALTKAPVLVSNDKVTIDGKEIKTELGATVADLQADTVATINAINVDGAATQTLTDGTKVAVIGKNAAINVYTVKINKDITDIKNITSYAEYVAAKLANPRAVASEVIGFGGKEADDSAIKLAQEGKPERENSSYYDWYIQDAWGKTTKPTETEPATWDKSDFNGYFVFETEIYNQSITTMQFVTDQGATVSKQFSMPTGKWSKVVLIVNESGDENDGKAIVYIDDKKATDWVAHSFGTLNSTTKTIKNSIRFIANGLKNEKDKDYSGVTDFGTAYIDNYKMYETTVFPSIDDIIIKDTVVAEGNPSKWVRGVVEEVDGFAGKTADNKVYKVTLAENANEDTAYSEIEWNRISEESKYLVIQSEVYSDFEFGGVYYATSQHAPLGGNLANASGIMGIGKWNKYIVVIDLENNYTADAYINGKLIQDDLETVFMTSYNDGKSIRNLIRMVYPLDFENASYFDNYKVYETKTYPQIVLSPVADNGIYGKVVLADNYVYAEEGVTVDDVANAMGKGTCVYTDRTLEIEEMSGAEVYNGLVAAIIDTKNDAVYTRDVIVVDEVPEFTEGEFAVFAESDNTTGPITVVAKAKAGDVFVVKQDRVRSVTDVDEEGNALGEPYEKFGTSTRLLNISLEDEIIIKTIIPNDDNGKIRAFMMDDLTSLRPLGVQKSVNIDYPVMETENVIKSAN